MNLKLLKIVRFFHLINKKNYNEKRQIEIVKKSPLFDAKWYLAQNPDVKAQKIGAAKHYVKYGWKEGRNPSPDFDTEEYLHEYPELEEKNWCPLFHYMLEHKELMPKIDYKEQIFNLLDKYTDRYKGKSADYKLIAKSKYFNKRWYLKTYPDVKKAKMDLIEHYMKYGWKEGRNPGPKFNTREYINLYSDIREAHINPLLHYLKYGKKEHRSDNIKHSANYIILKNSNLFDEKWYLKQNMDVANAGVDPIVHYLKNGWREGRNPSMFFDNDIYLYFNPDVKKAKINPLLHYLKYGIIQNRNFRFSDIKDSVFPHNTTTNQCKFDLSPIKKRRLAIYASFSYDGTIRESELYYLRGLKEVVDNIIYIADSPIIKKEVSKLKGLVCFAEFNHHGEYDFGSYKRGYLYALHNNLLKDVDELVVCNSSCLGPIYPFSEMFNTMEQRICDFWGFSGFNFFGTEHIQSFFYVFKKQVFISKYFHDFFISVKKLLCREYVVEQYEFRFTKYLNEHGFNYSQYIYKKQTPVQFPYEIIKNNRAPLVKIKAVLGDHQEKNNDFMKLISQINPQLYKIIIKEFSSQIQKKQLSIKRKKEYLQKLNKSDYVQSIQNAYREHIQKLKKKYARKKKINIFFFVYNTSMFAAQSLFEETLKDKNFISRIVIVPDRRFDDNLVSRQNAKYEELIKQYDSKYIIKAFNEETMEFVDISTYADLVVFSTPYNLSYFLYNQNYMAQKAIPSIMVNYGFYRSIYDRSVLALDAYILSWKISVETKYNLKELQNYSSFKGQNAILSGYTKMDSLIKYHKRDKNKKTIMLAVHHSIEGGFNNILTLSNFLRYADLFIELFVKYKDVNFIFRPHPALFSALIRKKIWSEQDVNAYIQKIQSLENVTYSHLGNYFQDFAESDAIINDCGSYLVEYFYTLKPQCYMLKDKKDKKQKFTKLGQRCLDNCYLAYTAEEIKNFIDRVVLQNDDFMQNERRKFAQKDIMLNYPNASKILIQNIKKELQK